MRELVGFLPKPKKTSDSSISENLCPTQSPQKSGRNNKQALHCSTKNPFIKLLSKLCCSRANKNIDTDDNAGHSCSRYSSPCFSALLLMTPLHACIHGYMHIKSNVQWGTLCNCILAQQLPVEIPALLEGGILDEY